MITAAHIGLTYSCQLNCKHCFVDKDIDHCYIAELRDLIKYLSERGLFFIYYSYGEPTLSSYFFEIANYCNSIGLYQILMTNGYSANKELAIQVKNSGIKRIMVSLDSSVSEKHDKNRGKLDSFKNAISAIKIYQNQNLDVGIATTITDFNIDEMLSIYELCKSLNVKTVSFLRLRDNGRLANLKKENIYIENIKKIINKEDKINFITHDYRLLPMIKQLYIENKISDIQFERYYNMNICNDGCSININPKGEIYRCSFNTNVIASLKDKPEKILEVFLSKKSNC